jgi:hypothetical protein
LLTIFYYEGNFEEAFELARQGGVKPYHLMVQLNAMLDKAPGAFQALIQDYLRENQEELFNTKEDCIAWAHKNFDALVRGDLGGNLLSKYSMFGRFYTTQATLAFLESGLRAAFRVLSDGAARDSIQAVMDYLRCVVLHVPFSQMLNSCPEWTTSFDVDAWRRDGYTKGLEAYRFSRPQTFSTQIRPDRKALIETKIATFGEHPSGLGKFTRTLFAQDLRRSVVYKDSL